MNAPATLSRNAAAAIEQTTTQVDQQMVSLVDMVTHGLNQQALEMLWAHPSGLRAAVTPPRRIPMVEIAPRTFMGLVRGRSRISPLLVGDHLFIFVPPQAARMELSALVTQLMVHLPLECQQHILDATSRPPALAAP